MSNPKLILLSLLLTMIVFHLVFIMPKDDFEDILKLIKKVKQHESNLY